MVDAHAGQQEKGGTEMQRYGLGFRSSRSLHGGMLAWMKMGIDGAIPLAARAVLMMVVGYIYRKL